MEVDNKGNCFYDSIVASSGYATLSATALRRDVGAHMREYRRLYEGFVTFNGTYEEYLANMEQTLEWATEIEIVAFANLSGCRLNIANQPRADWRTIDPADEFASNDVTIHLFYDGNHYDLLLPKNSDDDDEEDEDDEEQEGDDDESEDDEDEEEKEEEEKEQEEGDGHKKVSVWVPYYGQSHYH